MKKLLEEQRKKAEKFIRRGTIAVKPNLKNILDIQTANHSLSVSKPSVNFRSGKNSERDSSDDSNSRSSLKLRGKRKS